MGRGRRRYKFSTGNDTSSDSDSEHEDTDKTEEEEEEEGDEEEEEDDDDSSDHNASTDSVSNNSNTASNGNGNGNGNGKKRTTKGKISGYNIFFGVRCKEIQKSDPNLEFARISRNIGTEWKNLSKSQQQHWKEIGAKMTIKRKEEQEKKEKAKRDKRGRERNHKYTQPPPHKKMRISMNGNHSTTNSTILSALNLPLVSQNNHKLPLPIHCLAARDAHDEIEGK